MKPSQKLQLKLNQLEAEKMTVEMKITGERAKVTRLEELEAMRKELEFDIVATRNRVLAERKIEEKEQSAAEKWLKNEYGYKYLSINQKSSVDPWSIAAHEAGQKHQAEVERERVKPLVDRAKQFIKILPQLVLPIGIKNWQDIFTGALADYQRGWTITGPDLELPEKPSWVDDEKAEPGRSFSVNDKPVNIQINPDDSIEIKTGLGVTITPIKD